MPAPTLFSLQLLAEQPGALRRLRGVLGRHRGNVTTAAGELGVTAKAVYGWAKRSTAVAQILAEKAQGRAQAARKTAASRKSTQ